MNKSNIDCIRENPSLLYGWFAGMLLLFFLFRKATTSSATGNILGAALFIQTIWNFMNMKNRDCEQDIAA